MSLSISLMNALGGLQTNQNGLQVVSSNIANLNTPGYTRKIHEQESRVIDGVSVGVRTAGVVRKVDDFLRRDLVSETSTLGNAEVRAAFLDRLQQLFGAVGGNATLGDAITDLALAFETLAGNPEIAAHRIAAVNQAQDLARMIQDLSAEVQALRTEADQHIGAAMSTINAELATIAKLNGQIAQNGNQGVPTADLEDQRDAAIAKLAEFLEIKEFKRADGQVVVLTKAGRSLVNGGLAASLAHTPLSALTAAQSYPAGIDGIAISAPGSTVPGDDITAELASGKLAAWIEARDQTLPAMTAELDQLAASLRDAVNRVHNRAANTPLGMGSAAGDPATLWGSRTIADPGAGLTLGSDVTLQILDAEGNPATGPLVLSAGTTTADGILGAVDGYLGSGTGFGTAAWMAGRMEIKLEPGYRLAILDSGLAADGGDAAITFDADGDGTSETLYGFSNFFGLNDLFQTPELAGGGLATEGQGTQLGVAGTIMLRQDILDDPGRLARGMLRGSPPDLQLGAGDNEIAQQLAGVFTETFTIPGVDGGLPETATTLAGYAGEILSSRASAARNAEDDLQFQSAFHANLENRILSQSGVNLDEELSHMVIFQNAFAASARVMQTTNELFDTLLGIR